MKRKDDLAELARLRGLQDELDTARRERDEARRELAAFTRTVMRGKAQALGDLWDRLDALSDAQLRTVLTLGKRMERRGDGLALINAIRWVEAH